MRPRTGTANPSPSKKNSVTGPAWRSPTTSLASPPRNAGGWTRPTTGTTDPSPSSKNSVTAPAWRAPTTSSASPPTCAGGWSEAEDWYRRSLAIIEELGDRPGMAITYHQLGMTAQDRGRLDEAEDWYRKSLTIKEELGDRPGDGPDVRAARAARRGPAAARPGPGVDRQVRDLVRPVPQPDDRDRAIAPGPAHPPARHASPGASLAADHRPARAAGGPRLHHQPPRRR